MEATYNQIKKYMAEKDYAKALDKIREYLDIPGVGIYEELLSIYIKCLTELGQFDEAKKNIEILSKYFQSNDYYDIALKYIGCCSEDTVVDTLSKYPITPEQYYKIAQYCFINQKISLAELLFKRLLESNDPEIKNKAASKIEIIEIYKKYGDKVFQEQTYGSFNRQGKKLEPGYVIMAARINSKYKENHGFVKISWPLMIWKIEGNRIYTFPVTEDIDTYRYTIPKENYPGRKDRCLKDRLIVIDVKDITRVIDRIKPNDYNLALQTMYTSILHTEKGKWSNETDYFMTNYLDNKEPIIGNILVIYNDTSKLLDYYFIFDEDESGYYTYKVGGTYLPLTDNIQVEYIPKDRTITGIIKSLDQTKKELLIDLAPKPNPNQRLLKPNP